MKIASRADSLRMIKPAALAAACAILCNLTALTPAEAGKQSAFVTATEDLRFEPDSVTIRAGDTVVWQNQSILVHTVTDDPAKALKPAHSVLPTGANAFDSGRMKLNERFEHAFLVPGRYKYFCIPHEGAGMIGEVIVTP